MTKEEIFNVHSDVLLDTCGDIKMCLLRQDAYKAMDEYAKQQAIDFDTWKWQNRWHSFENGFWYQTLEHPTAMGNATYNKHHRRTKEQLYDQFIESQKQ